jgi:hypothetical protein
LTVAPDDETVVLRSEQDEIMIDGLKLTMSGEGLIEMLNTRIRVHHTRARDNAKLLKDHAENVAESVLEREIDESTDRIEALTLIRDHIVADEVYLLGEFDLRFADLLPDENWFDDPTGEPSTPAGRPGPAARAGDVQLVGTKD